MSPASKLEQVLIVIKTYPTISSSYGELVCTAGIIPGKGWVRIFPLPFRMLDYENRYKKYQWIEVPLAKSKKDRRPESYEVTGIDQLKLIGEPIGTQNGWAERRKMISDNTHVYNDLQEIIDKAHKNKLSIAVFKPSKVSELVTEEVEREWNKEKLMELESKAGQYSMFQTREEVKSQFSIVKKLPYKFSYQVEDIRGKQSKMMIEDWEIGMLYWKCLELANGDEQKALEMVQKKYVDEFSNKDRLLFLGTTKEFHFKNVPNPFVIIGVFYPPPPSPQGTLFSI